MRVDDKGRRADPTDPLELEAQIDAYISQAPVPEPSNGLTLFNGIGDKISSCLPWNYDREDPLGIGLLGLSDLGVGPGSSDSALCLSPMKDPCGSVVDWVKNFVSPTQDKTAILDDPTFSFQAGQTAVDVAPQLAAPEEISEGEVHAFIREMNSLLGRINEISEANEEEMNFEALLLSIYRAQIEHSEERQDTNKERIVQANQARKAASDERQERVAAAAKSLGKTKVWGMFERALTAVGLTVAASSMKSGWGVAALLFGLGTLGDDLLGDPVKASLATLFSGGDTEKEEEWLNRLRLGAGILSAITLLAVGGTDALGPTASAAKGVSQGIQALLQHDSNQHNAGVMESGESVNTQNEAIKKRLNENKKLVKTIGEFYRQLQSAQRSQLEASLAMTRQ